MKQEPTIAALEEAVLDAAIDLTLAQRREIVEEFFAIHPGTGQGRFGLGRAVLDFQDWEITSGRISDQRGSAWWRGVNGLMVLDIAATAKDSTGATAGANPWRGYASAKASQFTLWEAHQRSLHAALCRCAALLAHEPAAERAFVEVVIDVVDRTALSVSPTDGPDLAHLTERYYPSSYPAAQDALPGLELLRVRTADRLRGPDGAVLRNVGIASSRWG